MQNSCFNSFSFALLLGFHVIMYVNIFKIPMAVLSFLKELLILLFTCLLSLVVKMGKYNPTGYASTKC